MQKRKSLLKKLISCSGSLEEIKRSLASYAWDSEELVTLSLLDIISILEKCLDGKIDDSLLEEWANCIESREDIGYDLSNESLIKEVIFVLANPLLTERLSVDAVNTLKEALGAISRLLKCPCCQHFAFLEPGSYEICDVCGWEDDPLQNEDSSLRGGANGVSLKEARENYKSYGASSREWLKQNSKIPLP